MGFLETAFEKIEKIMIESIEMDSGKKSFRNPGRVRKKELLKQPENVLLNGVGL